MQRWTPLTAHLINKLLLLFAFRWQIYTLWADTASTVPILVLLCQYWFYCSKYWFYCANTGFTVPKRVFLWQDEQTCKQIPVLYFMLFQWVFLQIIVLYCMLFQSIFLQTPVLYYMLFQWVVLQTPVLYCMLFQWFVLQTPVLYPMLFQRVILQTPVLYYMLFQRVILLAWADEQTC